MTRPPARHSWGHEHRSLREVRDHFSDVVDRVQREHERVTVTRNGKVAAIILSLDDLAELEETLSVLSDPKPWPTSARPKPVAAAVIEFLTGALIANPRRVGTPLRGELTGIFAARRGTYRVLSASTNRRGTSSCCGSRTDETSTADAEGEPPLHHARCGARAEPAYHRFEPTRTLRP